MSITAKMPMKTTGGNQQTLSCGQCAYQTTRRDLLTRHVKTHESPTQQCGQCEFASSRNDVLSKHRKIAHEGLRDEASHTLPNKWIGWNAFLGTLFIYLFCIRF